MAQCGINDRISLHTRISSVCCWGSDADGESPLIHDRIILKYSYIVDTGQRNSRIVFAYIVHSLLSIHCLHDFAHKQESQLNSSVLITVWRVVIEKSVTGLPTKKFSFQSLCGVLLLGKVLWVLQRFRFNQLFCIIRPTLLLVETHYH